MDSIRLSKKAQKDYKKLPKPIQRNFIRWFELVEDNGIKEVRKIPGYHDEPLKGDRKGQRSIRLSRAYRAIYVEIDENTFNIIEVQEMNKHDY